MDKDGRNLFSCQVPIRGNMYISQYPPASPEENARTDDSSTVILNLTSVENKENLEIRANYCSLQ